MSILNHVFVGTNNPDKARDFYNAALSGLGINCLGEPRPGMLLYGVDKPEFVVATPANGESACHANGGTIGFAAATRAAVDEFHRQGLANGGVDEGAPGPRPVTPTAYGAYLRDPDGNKICAFCFAEE